MSEPSSDAAAVLAASIAVVEAFALDAQKTFPSLEPKIQELGRRRYGAEPWRLVYPLEVATLEAALAGAGVYGRTAYTGRAG
jgi:hypothetical protein